MVRRDVVGADEDDGVADMTWRAMVDDAVASVGDCVPPLAEIDAVRQKLVVKTLEFSPVTIEYEGITEEYRRKERRSL